MSDGRGIFGVFFLCWNPISYFHSINKEGSSCQKQNFKVSFLHWSWFSLWCFPWPATRFPWIWAVWHHKCFPWRSGRCGLSMWLFSAWSFPDHKTAQKLAFRIVTPGVDKPIFIILAIQSFTVCLIVPTITLFATFLHNGVQNWFTNWLQLAVLCFPVAFCLQIFFVGPLVRLIFRTLFRSQLADNAAPEAA